MYNRLLLRRKPLYRGYLFYQKPRHFHRTTVVVVSFGITFVVPVHFFHFPGPKSTPFPTLYDRVLKISLLLEFQTLVLPRNVPGLTHHYNLELWNRFKVVPINVSRLNFKGRVKDYVRGRHEELRLDDVRRQDVTIHWQLEIGLPPELRCSLFK